MEFDQNVLINIMTAVFTAIGLAYLTLKEKKKTPAPSGEPPAKPRGSTLTGDKTLFEETISDLQTRMRNIDAHVLDVRDKVSEGHYIIRDQLRRIDAKLDGNNE